MPLFKKKKQSFTDFSEIAVDLHSHVLPGLDDGSPSLEESVKMLKLWVELGYKKIITTPHVNHSFYPNTKEKILGQMYHLQDVIEEEGIALELEASGEYQLDDWFIGLLDSGEVIPFGEEDYILVELPFLEASFSFEKILDKISDAGYVPILAHPERYNYLAEDFAKYVALKERGLLFQLNMNSLNGSYGRQKQKTAERLIKEGMIDFVGSDAHFVEHLQSLDKLRRNGAFRKLVGGGALCNSQLL